MASLSPRTALDEKHYNFMAPTDDVVRIDELAQLKIQLEVFKNANPFLVAEIALELQVERLRVAEIMKARDSALNRLSDAYVSIRQKNEIIELLQEERERKGAAPFPMHLIRVHDTAEIDKLKAHIVTLEATIEELLSMRTSVSMSESTDSPPRYEEKVQKKSLVEAGIQTNANDSTASASDKSISIVSGEELYVQPITDDPTELVKARNEVLASIPLPDSPPDATLCAIVIPPPITLHEFLNMAPVSLKNALSTYRILQNNTTIWCPDREEHGYMYVPLFKCSTNPKVATAHRWTAVDPIGRMNKPTECFYHKKGVWYYAGSYRAFKLDTLTTKEWSQLPPETISTIVKETISARKNNSPQNTYETSQLYASGALKVACVGLQCVGFNQEVYKAIIAYSAKLTETKWKPIGPLGKTGTTLGSTPAVTTGTDAGPANAATKAPRTPAVARHISHAPMATGSPVTPQGPSNIAPAMQTTPTQPSSNGVVGVIPLGPVKSSIWSTAANVVSPSFGASAAIASASGGGPAVFVPSNSPLSATSKVFKSARGPVVGAVVDNNASSTGVKR